MSEQDKPKLGDYVVIAHRWDYELAGPLTRVSAQKVFWPSAYRDSERQAFKDGVLFSGAQTTAALLIERLKSSRALSEEEKRASALRHRQRTQEAIAKAKAEAPSQDAT